MSGWGTECSTAFLMGDFTIGIEWGRFKSITNRGCWYMAISVKRTSQSSVRSIYMLQESSSLSRAYVQIKIIRPLHEVPDCDQVPEGGCRVGPTFPPSRFFGVLELHLSSNDVPFQRSPRPDRTHRDLDLNDTRRCCSSG